MIVCEVDHWGYRGSDLTADLKPEGEPEANAEFIARACNSHYELLAACKTLLSIIHAQAAVVDSKFNNGIESARAAIAKAEGK